MRTKAGVRRCAQAKLRARAGDPGLAAKPVCPCRPSPPATVLQRGGGTPVLRPTLAGRHPGPQRPAASTRSKRAQSHDTANGACARGHHHRPASTEGGPPSVGAPQGCRGRWFGVRAEAPFAVSWLVASLAGVDGAARRGPHRVPRERGPENVPRATCPRAEAGLREATDTRIGPKATPRSLFNAVRFILVQSCAKGQLAMHPGPLTAGCCTHPSSSPCRSSRCCHWCRRRPPNCSNRSWYRPSCRWWRRCAP